MVANKRPCYMRKLNIVQASKVVYVRECECRGGGGLGTGGWVVVVLFAVDLLHV